MLEDAIKSFRLAIQAQREYIQLGHICYWCVVAAHVVSTRRLTNWAVL